MKNTWPGGVRKALYQNEHEAWNAKHYPGTREVCVTCDGLTGRCEEESVYSEAGEGPLCDVCYEALKG